LDAVKSAIVEQRTIVLIEQFEERTERRSEITIC